MGRRHRAVGTRMFYVRTPRFVKGRG